MIKKKAIFVEILKLSVKGVKSFNLLAIKFSNTLKLIIAISVSLSDIAVLECGATVSLASWHQLVTSARRYLQNQHAYVH